MADPCSTEPSIKSRGQSLTSAALLFFVLVPQKGQSRKRLLGVQQSDPYFAWATNQFCVYASHMRCRGGDWPCISGTAGLKARNRLRGSGSVTAEQ